VIVPTVGRPTLTRTLDALAPQLSKHDEVVVVIWARADAARIADVWQEVRRRNDPRITCTASLAGGPGGFGDQERTYGMQIAKGTHLAFIDDDDEHEPDALEHFRHAAYFAPNTVHLFRMVHPELGELWRNPVLECGNVGTPMVLVPNLPERLGAWRPDIPGTKTGDWTFIRDSAAALGGALFSPPIVARCHREPDTLPA
jgi:hypothetical protein